MGSLSCLDYSQTVIARNEATPARQVKRRPIYAEIALLSLAMTLMIPDMTKAELRKTFIAKRTQLSQVEYEQLNNDLLEQFKQLDLSGITCIHLFLPMHQRKEPDTFLIRDWLVSQYPHIKRVFPKADFAANTMENYLDNERLQIAINAFGIPEPLDGDVIDARDVDMVLVPLLALDRQGYRVGYGKGFYDRFMARCKPGTRFVGLSFFEPVDTISDVNEFDQQIQECILPRHICKLPLEL